MTASIVFLIKLLRRQAKYEEQKEVFRSETRFLMAILIIFDISFLLRLITDITLMRPYQTYNLPEALLIVTTPLMFDILPVCLILQIHSCNFKTIMKEQPGEGESQMTGPTTILSSQFIVYDIIVPR